MRYTLTVLSAFVALGLAGAAQAAEGQQGFVFKPAAAFDVAQSHDDDDYDDEDDQDARDEAEEREEIRRERAEKRRERAERRRREAQRDRIEERRDGRGDRRDDRRERYEIPRARFWIGIGAGVGAASIDVPCGSGSTNDDCTQSGNTGTYTANATFAGPYTALRIRGIREQDKGDDDRTPYEEAVLIGSRFGRSNWYGMAGVGRILHADNKHPEATTGFAWEILFAPSSMSATGMELSFQGGLGSDVDFVALNLGLRFGQLR